MVAKTFRTIDAARRSDLKDASIVLITQHDEEFVDHETPLQFYPLKGIHHNHLHTDDKSLLAQVVPKNRFSDNKGRIFVRTNILERPPV